MRILIIAAHPDDETLGCGGSLSRYYEDDKMLITLTDGDSARDNEKKFDRNLLTNDICKLYNISKFYSGNFPDNKLDSIPLLDIVKFIEKYTIDFYPDLIFTHHPGCLNVDHVITYKATITAFRPQYGHKYKILSFFIPSSTDYNPLNNFNGNFYITINQKNIDDKIKGLEIYNTEMRTYPHARSIENIINLTKIWGCEIGEYYCEKFQLIREII